MLSEDEIISQLKEGMAGKSLAAEGLLGIGDDAAAFPKDNEKSYVLATDHLTEGVHFRAKWMSSSNLAYKALAVNISDICAMGAKPLYVFLNLALPQELSELWVKDFLGSFNQACDFYKVCCLGGDTSLAKKSLFVNVTVVGEAKTSQLKLRSQAVVGDKVCVLGMLGDSRMGLELLESIVRHDIDSAIQSPLVNSHLRPEIFVQEAQVLGQSAGVQAMLDISDGLWLDLRRLCSSSQVQVEVDLECLPISESLKKYCLLTDKDPEEEAVMGGEDYCLLFTASPESVKELHQEFRKLGLAGFKEIGRVTKYMKRQDNYGLNVHFSQEEEPVKYMRQGKQVIFQAKVFEHFRGEG